MVSALPVRPALTIRERAASYARTFPKFPPLVVSPDGRWLYGVWKIGQYYKGSGYYGSYPPGYLKRVAALFPELSSRMFWPGWRVLHCFSGSLQSDCEVRGVRVDINATLGPDVCGDARRLPFADDVFDLVLADTPYGPVHARRYGTSMPARLLVTRELARVTRSGGHLVWLDTKMPMYRKAEWHEWGNIGLWRSTANDIRGVTCFERV